MNAIHVIDAFFIDNQNMIMDSNQRVYSLNEKYILNSKKKDFKSNWIKFISFRHSKLEILIKSINKASRQDLCPIRLKKIYAFEDIMNVVFEK